VTTKRGTAEKMLVTANFTMGWSRPTRLPELTNSAEYAELSNEVDLYDNRPPTYSEQDIATYASGADPWHYPSTDWFDEVLKPWSLQNNTNVTLSGGTENMRSFVSVSTRNQDGFFVNSASKYKQHDLRANIDKKLTNPLMLLWTPVYGSKSGIFQRSHPLLSSAT
jgi:hypothetical protein